MQRLLGKPADAVSRPQALVAYGRVSSHEQKARGDLGRQVAHIRENLQAQDVSHVVEITDVASGLSERRPGLLRLMEMARRGEVTDIAVTYKDRLTRFGYGYLEEFFSGYGVRIHVVDGQEDRKSVQEELVDDLIAIVTSFSFHLALPEIVRVELARGGRLQAPDLRRTRAGQWVLDVKVEALPKGERRGVPGRVLAFDWGLRNLLAAIVLQGGEPAAADGTPGWEQLSRPFFLRAGGIYAKLRELRVHAGFLRAKVDRLRNARQRAHPSAEERSAQAEWDAVWRRYEHLQDQLAHEASNFLLEMAVESGCSVIAGEWLGSLKSGTKSKDLNWRINSQIRSKILVKLRYKARRVGIRVAEVWPRGTSHRCPRCGADGQHTQDHPPCPEGKRPRHKPGSHGWAPGHAGTKHRPRRCSWLCCCRCGFNGDRDYAVALNIGVEYYAEAEVRRQAGQEKKRGRALAEAATAHRQAVSYKGAAVAMPFTSRNAWFPILSGRHGQQRQTHSSRQWVSHGGGLCGWRGRHVRVTPYVCPKRLPAVA